MYAFSAPRARNVIADLAARGQYHFTASELRSALGVSGAAARQALSRLAARGEIASPARGFYVIVPPEYRRLGCLPADQFIPALMERRNARYYVGLLSAAQYHGAAHHRPQELQVVLGAEPAGDRVRFRQGRLRCAPEPRCSAGRELQQSAGNGSGLDGGSDGRRFGRIHASRRRGGPVWRAFFPSSVRTWTRSASSRLRELRRSFGRSVWAISSSMSAPRTRPCCSRSVSERARETSPSCCLARVPTVRRGRRIGGCTSTQVSRRKRDPAGLHHPMAGAGAVERGLPGRAGPDHQPRPGRDVLRSGSCRDTRLPWRHGALQALPDAARALFGGHRSGPDRAPVLPVR